MTTQTMTPVLPSEAPAAETSAAPAVRRRPAPDLTGPVGIGFGRLLRMELRKLVDTRSGRGLLIAIALVTVAAVGLITYFTEAKDVELAALLSAALAPQMFLIPVFGVLAMTSESSQRTSLVTYCVEPRRWRVVVAKSLAAVAFALALLAVGALVAAAAHGLAIATKGAPGNWSVPWGIVGGLVLIQVLAVLQGVAFGLFFRSTALALVAFFVLPMAFSVVTSLVDRIRDIQPWIDLATAQLPLLGGGMTSGTAWAHLATTTGLWILLPLAVGTWLLSRREIA